MSPVIPFLKHLDIADNAICCNGLGNIFNHSPATTNASENVACYSPQLYVNAYIKDKQTDKQCGPTECIEQFK